MKIICISLERRVDRFERIRSHFSHMGLYDKLIILPAYDGARMPKFSYAPPPRPYFSFKDEFGSPSDRFNKYQIACSLSHIMALKMAKALRLPEVLIVEDDVEFTDRPDLDAISGSAPEDWEMIYLGYGERPWANKPRRDIDSMYISPGFTDGLHAYIVNQNGYDKLINGMLSFKTTNDDSVNDVRFREKDPLIAYALKKKIAFQISDYSELDRRVVNRTDLK